jgi:uncharacterized protein YoxC
MEGVSLIVMLLFALAIFMLCVLIIRWILGIDKIIDLQKEQLKSLNSILNELKENKPK